MLFFGTPPARRSALAAATAIGLISASTAAGQSLVSAGGKVIATIAFKPGEPSAVVSGVVSPSGYVGPDRMSGGSERYFLPAQAGQHLAAEIASDTGEAAFSLVQPSPAMARYDIVEGAANVKRWSGTLSLSGNYLIQVFTHHSRSSHFRLKVTLR